MSEMPGMACDTLPSARRDFLSARLSGFCNPIANISRIIHGLRETKSEWEVSMIQESGAINERMFNRVLEEGEEACRSWRSPLSPSQ